MFSVNRCFYLTKNNAVYTVCDMKYGERLRAAREHAKLKQEELASMVGIKQPSYSYLENPKSKATGSIHTARFARICRVSVDWLSDEIGEMIPDVYSTTDSKIIAAAKILEPMTDYGKDAAVKNITEIAQLIEHAKKGGNGTEG